MTLTVGSLFSGIGGLELGLERAGMTVKWQVEIDDYCTRILTKHWPNVPKFRDVRTVGQHNLEPVDLICGGFPCQPHSLAGRRQASDDERDLWGEFARLIGDLRPDWVLAENVPGLLSSENGRFFGRVLRDLAACGYDAEWDCIPAAAVGAPHQRDRVFIVAYPGSEQDNGQRSRPGRFSGRRRQPLAAGAQAIRPTHGQASHDDLTGYGTACRNVADATRHDGERYEHGGNRERDDFTAARGRREVGDTPGKGLAFWQDAEGLRQFAATAGASQWAVEPAVVRVADGVPNRIHRLRGLGNAVVPQVAEYIGRLITEAA